MGRAPTGRVVEEWVVTIMHFEGDKVVREWIGADKLGLFIQLGVLEDPWPKLGGYAGQRHGVRSPHPNGAVSRCDPAQRVRRHHTPGPESALAVRSST